MTALSRSQTIADSRIAGAVHAGSKGLFRGIMVRIRYAVLLTLATSFAVSGQEPAAPPRVTTDIMVFAGSEHYPSEWAEQGIQGRTLLNAEFNTDGTITVQSVVESSGSPDLDAAAPLALAEVKAKPREAAASFLVPVLFYKDSVIGLSDKRCADFNTDYAYFRSTFPDRRVNDMNVFKMAAGVAFSGGAIDMSRIAKVGSAPGKTVEVCARKPSSMFMKVYLASLRS